MAEIIRLQKELQLELTRRFQRQAALAFSDIVGSTEYFARFGDAPGRQLQQLHVDLVGECLGRHQGRLVDTAGDGAFVTFPAADAALGRAYGAAERRVTRKRGALARASAAAARALGWSDSARGKRPQVGDDRAEIRVGHPRVPVIAHRWSQLGAVLAHALGDRALDLIVSPSADAIRLVRRDVARHARAPGALEALTARAERVLEVAVAVHHRRMALHAVADGDE